MKHITTNPSDVRYTTLEIAGMTCGACERRVTRALEGLTGVLDVTVDLASGTATVEQVGGLTDDSSLVAAVRDAGYTARVVAATGDEGGAVRPARTQGCCGCCGTASADASSTR